MRSSSVAARSSAPRLPCPCSGPPRFRTWGTRRPPRETFFFFANGVLKYDSGGRAARVAGSFFKRRTSPLNTLFFASSRHCYWQEGGLDREGDRLADRVALREVLDLLLHSAFLALRGQPRLADRPDPLTSTVPDFIPRRIVNTNTKRQMKTERQFDLFKKDQS